MIYLPPDTELVVINYLRQYNGGDISGAVSDRIGSRTPPLTDSAWIQVNLINGQPNRRSAAMWLLAANVQIMCYGSIDETTMQQESSLLSRKVMQAVGDMDGYRGDGAIVSGTVVDLHNRVPDTAFTPPRERYIVGARISMHTDRDG